MGALLLLEIVGIPRHATLIFDQSPPVTADFDMTHFRLAGDFSLVQASTVTGINFSYGATLRTDLTSTTWAIYGDNSGAVGSLISTSTVTPTTVLDSSYSRFFATIAASSLKLGAGAYWLELHAGGANASHADLFSNTGVPGSSTAGTQLAFQFDGVTSGSAVTEPATYAMFAAGLCLGLPLQATPLFNRSPPNNYAGDTKPARGSDDFTLVRFLSITGSNFWYRATPQSDLRSATWAIYNHVAGAPGTLLASANATIVSIIDGAFCFASMPVPSLNLAEDSDWLKIHPGGSQSDTSGPPRENPIT